MYALHKQAKRRLPHQAKIDECLQLKEGLWQTAIKTIAIEIDISQIDCIPKSVLRAARYAIICKQVMTYRSDGITKPDATSLKARSLLDCRMR